MGGPSSEERSTVTLAEPLTSQGLPPLAHAKRAAAAARAIEPSNTQISHELALASLRSQELETARTMIVVGRLVGGAAMIPLPFLGGSVALRIAAALAIAFAIVAGTLLHAWLGKAGDYDDARIDRALIALAIGAAPAIFIADLYFGVYSAAQLFPALAIYFFSRREGLRSALGLYLLNAIAQGAAAALFIAGLVDDPGLIRPDLATGTLIVTHVLVQLGFLGAFLLGRGSHAAARTAMDKLQRAVVAAAQKDAQFNEARLDLDRALAIDGPGQYTDRTLGAYRLGNLIGRGGMGDVYEATHVETNELAAVKLLATRELGNPQSVERFLREVQIVRRLASPHVVRVLAASAATDTLPYLVMERLRGRDLAFHLRGGGLASAQLDTMLAQVGAAVEEAWQHGVVHRDLKPQNLFLTDDSGWKVLDFGVATLEDSSGTLTQGKVVGTPAYMAPEQARGERVDHHADVYAIAAVAYRWLTGRPAAAGKDLHTALYQTVHVMPPRPGSLAEVDPDVDAVLAIGLVKDPAARWDSIRDFRDALTRARDGKLDAATRERAAALLEKHPWGQAA